MWDRSYAVARGKMKTANDELQSAVASVQRLEKMRQRIDRQRNFWELVAVVLGGIAVTR